MAMNSQKMRFFWDRMEKKFMPVSAWRGTPLTFWRERILFIMCFTAATLGPLALIPSILMAVYEKLWLVVIFDITAYATLTGLLKCGHWPIKLRGGIACFILYFLGVALIIILGPSGTGYIWLFGASVIISAILGLSAAMWMLLINAATMFGTTIYIWAASPAWSSQMENALERWIVLAIIFLFFNAFVTITIAFMLNGLKEALIKEKNISNNLRLSEERYRSAHERFLTVLNSLDAFIYVVEIKSYEILFINNHLAEFLGKDITGRTCWRDLKGKSGPCSCCTMNLLLDKNGEPGGVQTWEEYNAIHQKWYINHDRAIRWVDGRLAKIQIATDITAVKKLESDLRQSQKMEAMGTLAGGIAHDFNNILSSIIGFTELAVEDAHSGTVLEDNLKEVLAASNRAKNLVKQILAFARQSDREITSFRVKDIVNESLKLIKPTIPTAVDIQSQILSNASVMGNSTEFHQVLMNLFTNAVYSMKEQTGILSVTLIDDVIADQGHSLNVDIEPGRYLKLSVADTGDGIAPRHLSSIFEPYFTTKPKGEGTGIGLAMVHGIIENYRGKIAVESKLGQGTRFDIYLPVATPQALPQRTLPQNSTGGAERILFVDDELSIVKMVNRTLSKLGYTVTPHTNSSKALEIFQKKSDQFDLVITDYAMPHMTGDTLSKRMLNVRPDIPIILCTGYSEKMSAETAKKIGIKGFIQKPIIPSELAIIIRRTME
jgi:two-component system cell cycle sensor histidine kinase/response regulator CckA